ncbi:type IV secretion system protein (plasmid) [Serratia marcescens]|uniref:type IV secretion system protein n=1 Tax=Serratia marcescens TaxID=615 RepID=UPI003FA7313B
MSGGIFIGVEKHLIGGVTNATKGLMMNYSHMIMGLAATSATLYIMWRGYQTLAGKLTTPMEDTMWDIMRMAIILSFVANVSGYLDGVIDAIKGLKEGFSGSDNIWVLLDTLWDKAKFLGKTLHDLDNSEFIKDEGWTAETYVWLGTFALMVVTAFVSMVAEIMILLLSITAPIFIFCLMYGFLRPMFNNWLQNIFTAILTILFSALSLRIVIIYLKSRMDLAASVAIKANIVELGAQVCLAGICAAVLVYFSAKLAGALAGAAATASMQGLAAVGVGAAVFGANKLLNPRPTKVGSQGGGGGAPGGTSPSSPGGQKPYDAREARKNSIRQMEQRNAMRKGSPPIVVNPRDKPPKP